MPGPGLYQDSMKGQSRPQTFSQPRNKHLKYAVVFNTSEKRFKAKGPGQGIYRDSGTQAVVGPGSYINNENSMIKKSFNMSMEHSYFV